jgi:hypothetical protein
MICQKKEWEDKILAAEKLALLKGSICCLFRKGRDDNGNDIYDWNLFDNRLKKIKKYFEEESGEMKKDYKTDSKLLRHFIALFTIPEHFKVLEYDNRPATWKNILKEPLYIEVLNKFFDPNFDSNSKETLEDFSSSIDESFKFLQKDLCESKVLNFVAKGSYLKFHHQKLSLSPKYARKDIFVLADERNMILSKLEEDNIIKISDKHIVKEGVPYFKGWDIEFKYNEENYIYRTQNDLYKTEEEKKEMSPKELNDFLRRGERIPQ